MKLLGTPDAFPWREGNGFELIADSGRFFARMLEAIETARDYVLLEMYLVESGILAERFIDALSGAAQRGAHVAVLLDGFGSLGLTAPDRRRLIESGAQLRLYNEIRWRRGFANLMRNHRKLLVVDGRIAFAGGAGITDEFAGYKDGSPPWRDLMVEIRGPVIADWQQAFLAAWNGRMPASIRPVLHTPVPLPGGMAGRVITSDGWHRAALADSTFERIESAARRIWLVSAYFIPSRRFRKALRIAVRRGVDVRLLVPGPRTDHPLVRHAARRFYGKLLRNGVRIFEYQPSVLHAKMVICDDWVSVGSSNLDRWSFKWNLEANQEVASRIFAEQAAEVFESDIRQSVELDRRTWSRRAWSDRLGEHIAGALDRALERWIRRGGRR